MSHLAAVTQMGQMAFPAYLNASVDSDGNVKVILRDELGRHGEATFKPAEWAEFRRQVIANV